MNQSRPTVLLAVISWMSLAAQQTPNQGWTGWVSDPACGRSISVDCNKKCIAGGVAPVFVVDKTGDILSVSNPDPLKQYAGQHVEVAGTLNAQVLTVAEVKPLNDSATPAFDPPPVRVHLPDNKSFVQFPFELLANGVYVPVRVNGKGPYLFELDTGSSNSVIAAEAATELGIKTEGTMQGTGEGSDSNAMGMISNLDLLLPQGLALSTQQGATVVMSGLWPLIGRRMYGDLGYDVIGDFVVEINYEKKLLTIHDPDKFQYTGTGASVPFKLLGGTDPQIQGELSVPNHAPIPVALTLDTGAGGTVLTAPLVKSHHLLDGGTKTLAQPSRGVGEVESTYGIARATALRLGPYVVDKPLVALSQDTEGAFASEALDVNLGGNVLRRFNVIIDYPHRRLILEPNSFLHVPQAADASGLVLKAEGANFRTFVVRGIRPDSPASEAGLTEGDIISGIKGLALEKYALWELEELFQKSGQVYKIKVQRGDKSFVRALRLRALL